MKKKSLTYLVAFIVVLIWSKLIHDFCFKQEDDLSPTGFLPDLSSNEKNIDTIIYDIAGTYEDPFLKKSLPKKQTAALNSPTLSKKKEVKTKAKEEHIKWLDLQYQGYVSGSSSEEKKGIVTLGGRTDFLRINQDYNDFMVTSITKDSITLKASNDSEKTYYK